MSETNEPETMPDAALAPETADPWAVVVSELALALDLVPADADRLRSVPELARVRGERARTYPRTVVWHDTPDDGLARQGLALEEDGRGAARLWHLVQMCAPGQAIQIPGTPSPVLAGAPDAETALAGVSDIDGPLLPVAAFDGTRRTMRLAAGDGQMSMTLEQGVLRAVTAARPVCRIVLQGPPGAVLEAALAVAGSLGASLSPLTFAAGAVGLARPLPAPRRACAPALAAGMTVDDAFAHVIAHQTATLLRLAPTLAERRGTEPVHQMRVATRRLRAAMKVFAHAGGCPELGAAKQALRELAHVLGPARDWDVFTEETAAGLETCHEEAAVRRLLAAARRRRAAGYAALADYIASPAFRVLGVRLAGLAATRPWVAAEAADETPLADFAAQRLSRLQRKLLAVDEDVTALPAVDLHALRLRAKRLRYAAELFAPLFPGKSTGRCIRRVSALQEALGVLNDGAVTAKLVAEIEPRPGFAAGVVAGHVAARASGARAHIGAAWRKLARTHAAWS